MARVEAVDRENGFFADDFALMRELVLDKVKDSRNVVRVHDPGHGGEGHADLDDVGRAEVTLERVDQEEHQLVILTQKQRDSQVSDPLFNDARLLDKLDGVDITKGRLMAQHFAVDDPNEVFPHLPLQ